MLLRFTVLTFANGKVLVHGLAVPPLAVLFFAAIRITFSIAEMVPLSALLAYANGIALSTFLRRIFAAAFSMQPNFFHGTESAFAFCILGTRFARAQVLLIITCRSGFLRVITFRAFALVVANVARIFEVCDITAMRCARITLAVAVGVAHAAEHFFIFARPVFSLFERIRVALRTR